MPAPEESDRYQPAVLWPFMGYNSQGEPKVGDPRQIWVRWQTKRRDIMGRDGNTIAVDATVEVDEVVHIDSLMWKGHLDRWAGTGTDVPDETEIMVVVSYDEVPDLKDRFIEQTVSLARYKKGLP